MAGEWLIYLNDSDNYMLQYIFVAIIIFMVLFYLFIFLRNPKRSISKGHNIICPANGKVVKIIETGGHPISVDKGILGKVEASCDDIAEECYFVAIMMNIANVHYQRAPIDGKVESIKRIPGKFVNAVYRAGTLSALQNEQSHMVISGKDGRVKVIQVAGFVARRIVCFVEEGQKVIKGQDIGMIRLGSMVCLVFPKNGWNIRVKEGDPVTDGETIVAEKSE